MLSRPTGFHGVPAARFLTALVVTCLTGASARATIHDWVAVGTIAARGGGAPTTDCIPNGLAGSTFRYDWTFDDTVVDGNANPHAGDYQSITAWRMRITGSGGMDDFSGSVGDVHVFDDDTPGGSDFYLISNALGPSPSVADCGTSQVGTSMNLESDDESVFVSDFQPNVVFFAGDFDTNRTLGVAIGTPSGSVLLGGTISDFYQLGSPQAPWLPYQMTTLSDGTVVWYFTTSPGTTCVNVTGGCWFDPPVAEGFVYETDGSSRFTEIADFPSGFDQEFEVWAGGSFVGTFGPGESVDFSGQPGGGVVKFTVRGIDPGVDPSDDLAFPLKLVLDTAPASFTMRSLAPVKIPALGAGPRALLGLALLGAAAAALRSRR
jgi:hypothetical protein